VNNTSCFLLVLAAALVVHKGLLAFFPEQYDAVAYLSAGDWCVQQGQYKTYHQTPMEQRACPCPLTLRVSVALLYGLPGAPRVGANLRQIFARLPLMRVQKILEQRTSNSEADLDLLLPRLGLPGYLLASFLRLSHECLRSMASLIADISGYVNTS
jgi:hypothetical protein